MIPVRLIDRLRLYALHWAFVLGSMRSLSFFLVAPLSSSRKRRMTSLISTSLKNTFHHSASSECRLWLRVVLLINLCVVNLLCIPLPLMKSGDFSGPLIVVWCSDPLWTYDYEQDSLRAATPSRRDLPYSLSFIGCRD